MRFLRAGASAVLVELDDLDQVTGVHAALRRTPPAGIVDLVPAARTILAVFDPSLTTAAALSEDVSRREVDGGSTVDGAVVELPVVYDGADLPDVAARTGLSEREVVDRHLQGEYRVAFCGFAPGFAYIVGADPALNVPRRDSPRTRVPAGSVALAGEFTGVYPREMPGGWQLIGHTDAPLWSLDRDPPALLPPGTRVRFLERK